MAMTADLRIGTCGYSFPDWRGILYPAGVKPSMYLVYYARSLGFNAVEIDSSFYRMPSVPLFESILQKTPPGFLFTIKALQQHPNVRGPEQQQPCSHNCQSRYQRKRKPVSPEWSG
jgi:uncharacterized protein YecE (DUF72 family)